MKTIEEIAQWVIDNRYPKSENDKVSDFEMYQTLIEVMNKALRQPLVSGSVCEHLHQKWEGEYPHNCKKVCQVCREVLAN